VGEGSAIILQSRAPNWHESRAEPVSIENKTSLKIKVRQITACAVKYVCPLVVSFRIQTQMSSHPRFDTGTCQENHDLEENTTSYPPELDFRSRVSGRLPEPLRWGDPAILAQSDKQLA